MTIHFGYDKKQVLDGLRSHFFGRPEIRILFILVNLFAILSAVLFYFKKIQPFSFLIFSFLWFLLWLGVRRMLPLSIYKKSHTFHDTFSMDFSNAGVLLKTEKGEQTWPWERFSEYKETLYFFHLYFNPRSFFMVPKDAFEGIEDLQEVRALMKTRINAQRKG
jgi:YcxB-like protein